MPVGCEHQCEVVHAGAAAVGAGPDDDEPPGRQGPVRSGAHVTSPASPDTTSGAPSAAASATGPRRSTGQDRASYASQPAGHAVQLPRFGKVCENSSIVATGSPPSDTDTVAPCGKVRVSPTAYDTNDAAKRSRSAATEARLSATTRGVRDPRSPTSELGSGARVWVGSRSIADRPADVGGAVSVRPPAQPPRSTPATTVATPAASTCAAFMALTLPKRPHGCRVDRPRPDRDPLRSQRRYRDPRDPPHRL